MKPEIEASFFIIYVANQAISKAFYSELLNSQPVIDVPGMTEFNIGDKMKLGIMPETGIATIICPTAPHPNKASGIPRCEIYLRVSDAQLYLERAIKLGAKKISAVEPRNWGDNVAYVSDPDGHILAFASR